MPTTTGCKDGLQGHGRGSRTHGGKEVHTDIMAGASSEIAVPAMRAQVQGTRPQAPVHTTGTSACFSLCGKPLVGAPHYRHAVVRRRGSVHASLPTLLARPGLGLGTRNRHAMSRERQLAAGHDEHRRLTVLLAVALVEDACGTLLRTAPCMCYFRLCATPPAAWRPGTIARCCRAALHAFGVSCHLRARSG